MDQARLEHFKRLLEEKKGQLEKDLSRFATKDPNVKGDWDTKYPNITGGADAVDEETDEVEQYENSLEVEHTLEKKLREVNEALQRIEEGTYGKCPECGTDIPEERLEALPEAKSCASCAKE